MNEKLDELLHQKLPIGKNEKILQVVRHHWFAYVSVYIISGLLCVVLLATIVAIVAEQTVLGIGGDLVTGIVLGGILLIAIIFFFSMIPVWIKKQEVLILTEESLLQLEKPSVFASKTSQLNLQHINDVSVNQDMLGSLFGYGNLTIETPGEQNNYVFTVAPDPQVVAKVIIEAHENYSAALESGQIQTTLGGRAPQPGTAWRPQPAESMPPKPLEEVDYLKPAEAAEQHQMNQQASQEQRSAAPTVDQEPSIPKPPTI